MGDSTDAEAADATRHPRPSLRRAWESLDGEWEAHLDRDLAADAPGDVKWDASITVPFAPETPASGLGAGGFVNRCWYRRRIAAERPGDGSRVLLHFGAVDRMATVWVNGAPVARHEGGYAPFSVDVTDRVAAGDAEVVVRADDDPADLEAPRGKQDWREEPHAIWYPRTTGIWRTVWLERVGRQRVTGVRWHGDPRTLTLAMRAEVTGGHRLAVLVRADDRVLVNDVVGVNGPVVERTFAVGAGFDDRDALAWWPRRPRLLDVELALLDGDGAVLDEVRCDAALRTVEVQDGHVLLNSRPYALRLVLDQGYWPASGLTPPSPEALRRDIELTRALGFNGVRKHQKVEDPRYLALADRLGLLVWVELPSAYEPGPRTAARLLDEWRAVVEASRTHPSVIAWVPLNESWGVPAVEHDAVQRALVDALAAVTRALDGTRPVSANDGWETAGGDIVGVHDYTQDPDTLRRRYGTREAVDALLTGRRPDGRLADLDRRPAGGRAVILSEFGGIALGSDEDPSAWGYDRAADPADLVRRYREQWAAVHESDALAGACWTQLTDVHQEVNGLLRFDRTPKAPLDELAAATRGRPPEPAV